MAWIRCSGEGGSYSSNSKLIDNVAARIRLNWSGGGNKTYNENYKFRKNGAAIILVICANTAYDGTSNCKLKLNGESVSPLIVSSGKAVGQTTSGGDVITHNLRIQGESTNANGDAYFYFVEAKEGDILNFSGYVGGWDNRISALSITIYQQYYNISRNKLFNHFVHNLVTSSSGSGQQAISDSYTFDHKGVAFIMVLGGNGAYTSQSSVTVNLNNVKVDPFAVSNSDATINTKTTASGDKVYYSLGVQSTAFTTDSYFYSVDADVGDTLDISGYVTGWNSSRNTLRGIYIFQQY